MLELQQSNRGILVEGDGRLTFCPCLGTPIALGFKSATVAPPGDLFLTSPRLEIFNVPVFWLPWFWLRAPSRVGLLPPQIEWRGADGLFLGGGVHLPWHAGSRDVVVDLSGGGYVNGGFAVEAVAKTDSTTTRVRFDRLPQSVRAGLPGDGSGLVVDARGSFSSTDRNTRARRMGFRSHSWRARSFVDDGSRSSIASIRVGVAEASLDASSFIVATGVRTAATRGGDIPHGRRGRSLRFRRARRRTRSHRNVRRDDRWQCPSRNRKRIARARACECRGARRGSRVVDRFERASSRRCRRRRSATDHGALCRRTRAFRSHTSVRAIVRVERSRGRTSSSHRAVRRGERSRERTNRRHCRALRAKLRVQCANGDHCRER